MWRNASLDVFGSYALITIKSLDVGNKITYSEILTQYIG